ncbi:ATP-binding cassette sub-family C member 12-like [Oncorhynchus nerka]|uniref:ATP-binding cassette sub-family C member 12-like n=1 Tax=Oncorhynchus nerka TaxID=8023 RepID=UPI0031B7F264
MNVYQTAEKEVISGLSYRKRSDSVIWNYECTATMEMNPEGLPSLDYREEDPPPNQHFKYHSSLQNMIPFRFSNKSNPMDDAGFFSFTSFAWMTPMMWSLFRNRLDKSSLSLSSHDGAKPMGRGSRGFGRKRFERLWEEEVAKVGLEKASLGLRGFGRKR